ncbi:Glycosyltransferase involved in cell wall bisynthesis [Caldithrix abyssi DSM 13497]|nr:Glycosyltransferase involved in cell wall bisynthesis [Caldithrix abyssi DSM 13497]
MIQLINSLDKSKYSCHVLLIKDSIVSDKLKENGISFSVARSKFYKKYYHYFIHSEAGYIKWYQIIRFFRLSILWLLSRYYFAQKELFNHRADIVHLNSLSLTDWLAPSSKVSKVVIHIREPFRQGRLDFIHFYFRHQYKKYADVIIAISKDNAKRIGLPDKTKVIYNFAQVPENSHKEESYYSKSFLYLGGAAKIKGFFTLVKALDYLDKDVKIYFGGDYTISQKKKGLKQIIKRFIGYGKKRQAAIKKMRSHTNAVEIGMTYQVDKYLQEVCCLISPFTVPHFSRPVIEAHLYKKPAIGSNVYGMDEIIQHKINGLLFEKDNAIELAKTINYIANHPNEAKRMGEKGYTVAKEKYSPDNIKIIEKVYDSLG